MGGLGPASPGQWLEPAARAAVAEGTCGGSSLPDRNGHGSPRGRSSPSCCHDRTRGPAAEAPRPFRAGSYRTVAVAEPDTLPFRATIFAEPSLVPVTMPFAGPFFTAALVSEFVTHTMDRGEARQVHWFVIST